MRTLAARRPIALAALVAATTVLSACGGSGTTSISPTASSNRRTTASSPPPSSTAYAPSIDPAQFTGEVTNRFLPLSPGTTFVSTGHSDGTPERDKVTVTHQTKTIVGVPCVVVHDVVSQQGKVIEATWDWFAQDTDGNVWYFGEDSKEYKNGKVTSTEGSWQTGVDGAQPGIVMEASPKVGDTYRQEYLPGQAEDMATVIKVDASKTVPTGSYQHVVVTRESTALEPGVVELKYYSPGVGWITGNMIKGGTEESSLVKIIKN